MRIGFASYYRRHENVAAAFRLADFCQRQGWSVSFFSPLDCLYRVHPRWDRRVVSQSRWRYQDWVRTCQAVVWTEPFSPTHVEAAASFGVKTIVLALRDALTSSLFLSCDKASHVIAPCRATSLLLQERHGIPAKYIPWDAGCPVVKKNDVLGARIKLIVPLHGTQTGRVDTLTIPLLGKVACECPEVDISILYSSRSFRPETFKEIRKSVKECGAGRLSLLCAGKMRPEDVSLQYGKHDLLAWPSEVDGTGSIGLESLSFGTPVLAYRMAPVDEYIRDGVNGKLVPCGPDERSPGAAWVKACPGLFHKAMVRLLTDRDSLQAMQYSTSVDLAGRQEEFSSGWRKVLNSV